MISLVAEFLGLTLFATGVVGVAVLARKLVQVAAARASIEATKAQAQNATLRHDLRIAEHQRNLQVLALTAGTGKATKQQEEPPEEVKISGSDVIPPVKTHEEWKAEEKLRKEARFAPVAKVVEVARNRH